MAIGDVRRGEVYLLDTTPYGGRLGKKRPVVVVQNDIGNRFSPETLVAAIRDPHGGRPLPVYAQAPKGEGGLAKDSIVDAGHISTVPKDRLTVHLGAFSPVVMADVDRALRVSFGLP